MRKLLSVIVPAFNEEQMVKKAVSVIGSLLEENDVKYEIIMVDDGSKDQTWGEIQAASAAGGNVKGIHFSRNFGKEAAIMAGLGNAAGDCCVVIDCDLQMPPETIIEMYRKWEEGFEIIEGRKRSRGKESSVHAFAAGTFYKLISKATGFEMENASDFKLLDRKAVDVLINMKEKNAFFRALSSWIGFKTTEVLFDVKDREAGESKWSTRLLVKYAINNITSFSTAPLQIVTILGVVMLVVSIVFGLISLIQKICGTGLPGFTTIIILLLFSSSIIMISLGIIGYYVACIYEEIKGRPKYIISEICGGGTDD